MFRLWRRVSCLGQHWCQRMGDPFVWWATSLPRSRRPLQGPRPHSIRLLTEKKRFNGVFLMWKYISACKTSNCSNMFLMALFGKVFNVCFPSSTFSSTRCLFGGSIASPPFSLFEMEPTRGWGPPNLSFTGSISGSKSFLENLPPPTLPPHNRPWQKSDICRVKGYKPTISGL